MDNYPNNKNKDVDTRTLGAPMGGEGWLTSSGRNSWTLVTREVPKNIAVSWRMGTCVSWEQKEEKVVCGEQFLWKAGTALCWLPTSFVQTPSSRAILSCNQLNNLFQNSRIFNPQVPRASINQFRHTPCSYNVPITASCIMAQRQASCSVSTTF